MGTYYYGEFEIIVRPDMVEYIASLMEYRGDSLGHWGRLARTLAKTLPPEGQLTGHQILFLHRLDLFLDVEGHGRVLGTFEPKGRVWSGYIEKKNTPDLVPAFYEKLLGVLCQAPVLVIDHNDDEDGNRLWDFQAATSTFKPQPERRPRVKKP